MNLARRHDVDPERALQRANHRFEERMRSMEAVLGEQGRRLDEADLEELEALWQEAKAPKRPR